MRECCFCWVMALLRIQIIVRSKSSEWLVWNMKEYRVKVYIFIKMDGLMIVWLVIFHALVVVSCCCFCFLLLLFFFKIILSGTLSECQTVWFRFRTDVLSVLIWVHTVVKGYQQTTKDAACKERDCGVHYYFDLYNCILVTLQTCMHNYLVGYDAWPWGH